MNKTLKCSQREINLNGLPGQEQDNHQANEVFDPQKSYFSSQEPKPALHQQD